MRPTSSLAAVLVALNCADVAAWHVAARPVLARSLRARPAMTELDYIMSPPKLPAVKIQYCTGCKWMMRAAWYAQELLTTFEGTLAAVELQPNSAGDGIFEVTLATNAGEEVIWDRKTEGGFPEAKQLKQIVRDVIEPKRDLGHSDAGSEGGGGGGEAEGGKRFSASGAFERLFAMIRRDRAARGETR